MAEQAGGGQEEQAPAAFPLGGFGAVSGLQDLIDAPAVPVEVGEPVLGGPSVVGAGPAPFLLYREFVGAQAQQAVAGHDAGGEELAGDPVSLVVGVEAVGGGAVGEDMDEQAAVLAEPASDAAQEFGPVGDVFEHLDRDDAGEG